MESAPAPCFMCGQDLRCQGYAQYCDVTTGGALGAASTYRCTALHGAADGVQDHADLRLFAEPGRRG